MLSGPDKLTTGSRPRPKNFKRKAQIDTLLDEEPPPDPLGPILYERGVKDAMAIASLSTQTTYPVVRLLAV